jgi:hypothetical protein
MFLFLRTFFELLRFHGYLLRNDFPGLYRTVRDYPRKRLLPLENSVERICRCCDIACVCYPTRVLCLQRSAATVCLLRAYGIPAQLVIGVQDLPFKAHAWVEVQGSVVNDKPYTSEMYQALERC